MLILNGSSEYLKTYFHSTDNKSILREYIQALQLSAIFLCQLKDYKQVRFALPFRYQERALTESVVVVLSIRIYFY